MLREVEVGRVGTVITKDLSRLGRNYLKTGVLKEIIFPEYEVRYIAINAAVKSKKEKEKQVFSKNSCNIHHKMVC